MTTGFFYWVFHIMLSFWIVMMVMIIEDLVEYIANYVRDSILKYVIETVKIESYCLGL